MLRKLYIAISCLLLSSCTTLHLKNDVFSKTDEDFTHGTEFIYQRPIYKAPDILATTASILPDIAFNPKNPTHVEFTVGQHIYTPNDLRSEEIVKDSNPYAGWLFGDLKRQVITEDTKRSTGLTLGVIGKYSGAEQAQKFVHNDLGKGTDPKGWDHQLGTEVGIIGSTKYEDIDFRYGTRALEFDVFSSFETRLGNIHTDATYGKFVRLGTNMPSMKGYRSKFSLYAYGGSEVAGVVRNIFYDGNTFKDSHRVESEPVIGRLKAGSKLQLYGWELGLDLIYTTPEHKQREKGHTIWLFSISKALQDLFN